MVLLNAIVAINTYMIEPVSTIILNRTTFIKPNRNIQKTLLLHKYSLLLRMPQGETLKM